MQCIREPFTSANDEQLSHKLDHNSILPDWMETHRLLPLVQVMLRAALLRAYASITCTAETMTENGVTVSLTKSRKQTTSQNSWSAFYLKPSWDSEDAVELFQLCTTATQYKQWSDSRHHFLFPYNNLTVLQITHAVSSFSILQCR